MASLARTFGTVGALTLLSRLLGFARDLLIARLFGADADTDAFFVAFRVPNLLRRLFAEGGFSAALVPHLTACRERQGATALRALLARLTGTLGAYLFAATLLGMLLAPWLVAGLAPGFVGDAEQWRQATLLTRLTLPYALFIGLAAVAGSALNSANRFALPATAPVLLNLVLIASALLLAPHLTPGVTALAWGLLLAGIAQWLWLLPASSRLGLLPLPRFAPRDPLTRRALAGLAPALLAVSALQINLTIDALLASLLGDGSISWLYYAERLLDFPLGILGVALGIVIAPRLARGWANLALEDFSATLDWALRWTLLLGAPAAVGLWILSGPIVAALFQSSQFAARDVAMAAQALMAYTLGLLPLMAIKVLLPGFLGRQSPGVPLRAGLLAILANLVLDVLLLVPLRHVGLALATALAAALNAWLLLRALRRETVYVPTAGWRMFALRCLLSALAMGVALFVLAGPQGAGSVDQQIGLGRLLGLILSGAGLYLGMLLMLGLRPHQVWRHRL